jgi:L-fuculose-phosphate aldolase
MTESELRESIVEVGRRMVQFGLVVATEGNISARLGPDQLLITPSGVSKGFLQPRDLVVTDLQGNAINGVPSSEFRLHVEIYAQRPDCQAVVHAHPPYATAWSMGSAPLPCLSVESAAVLGEVALVPFAMPGTDEVAETIRPLMARHRTFLLSHHGAVALGKSPIDALFRMETLERTAQIATICEHLGGAQPMPISVEHLLQNPGL